MTTFAEPSTSPSVDPTPETVDFASLGLPRQVVETLALYTKAKAPTGPVPLLEPWKRPNKRKGKQ